MASLTMVERVQILIYVGFGDKKRTFTEACNLFNAENPDRSPIARSTVRYTYDRFWSSNSVDNRPKTGRPKIATDCTTKEIVMENVINNPHISIRQLSRNHNISVGSAISILQSENFFPYKPHFVQMLEGNDFNNRSKFCELVMERCITNPQFAYNIIFTDEATFWTDGQVSPQNNRYWSDENPYWLMDTHTQRPKKVNVWVGLTGRKIIGPFFIEENLNSEKYLSMLQDQIVPSIMDKLPEFHSGEIWYQHDGAPAHYGIHVRQYLNQVFHTRWIGRGGPMQWPPRSPDLNPLDFFLWGYVKAMVYKDRPQTPELLKEAIEYVVTNIQPEILSNTIQEFQNRLSHCLVVNGSQFEHLL